MKKIIYTLSVLVFISVLGSCSFAAPVSAPVKPAAPASAAHSAAAVSLNAAPLSVVNNPAAYLNKTISFSGEFVSFTSLGLDYKPAFRDSAKYIGVLIRRPDVQTHIIPLSEMKMFMTRETAEKNIDIEAGDKFRLKAKVFSAALGDPWLDIIEFEITDKKNKTEKNNN